MTRSPRLQAVLAAALMAATPAMAQNGFSAAFVEAFAGACVPQRLSYDGTVSQAKAEGWVALDVGSHPEFAAVMQKSDEGLQQAKAEGIAMGFRSEALTKTVDGRPLHMIVSFAESEHIDEIGCYLYDFDAAEPIDRAPVSALLGSEPGQTMDDPGIVSAVWGPPEAMPRTLDTYLTFIPPGSEHVAAGGFDGVVLQFSTSAEGE